MKLLADENVDGRLVSALRDAGYEVAWVVEDMPGAGDAAVLESARTNDALLLTDDLDFGELVFRQRRAASGVLLLRLAGLSIARKAAVVLDALKGHAHELRGRFAVLDLRQLRVRPLHL